MTPASHGAGKRRPQGSAKHPNPKDKTKGPGGGGKETPAERKIRLRQVRKEHPELR